MKRCEVPEQKIEVRSDSGNDTGENFSKCAKLAKLSREEREANRAE